ncbi:MAG: nitronate monooxygenase family protein [Bacteroidales bacterium]|jgi:enoyl-[acyl-carrier protein] reductase II|nr:nitronate monooxygenase family protein [Bacteroidales bacterium]
MNRITALFGIRQPIIQGGMVWNSGWRLASAVSNSGGLGLLGAGSMPPDVLEEHIAKCRQATMQPFGVNLPLMYAGVEEQIRVIIRGKVPVVFTSAGSPKTYTSLLHQHGVKVAHVTSSLKFALKAQEASVDAVVAEGFEAGGHNGKEETTTFCLIPNIKKHVSVPVIAAGGIATGQQMLAAQILGADGVQIGSRFAVTRESSAHERFKTAVVNAREGDTFLTLKEITPVRLLKNNFFYETEKIYAAHGVKEDLVRLLGKGRARKGMFEGDTDEGELEIGQCASLIDDIPSVEEVFRRLNEEYQTALNNIR